jgi:hypothetical protein
VVLIDVVVLVTSILEVAMGRGRGSDTGRARGSGRVRGRGERSGSGRVNPG